MRPQALFLLLAFCVAPAASQNTTFPLEAVAIEGSSIPQPVVLEIAGLRIGSQIDKEGIDKACKNLQESGLFASITYRYDTGPNKGYLLTLTLADQTPLAAAAADIPGLNEKEVWQWVVGKFGKFDHEVPQADAAQIYLARQMEEHFAGPLKGQHLVVRMETDLATRKMTLSFQPDKLPFIRTVNFTGNQVVSTAELGQVLKPVVTSEQYTERKFATAVELNLRPVYDQRGLYRARFEPGSAQPTEGGVALSVAITEGPSYHMGKVEVVGENLPVNAMLAAARFPNGQLANWREIQKAIQEMEKVVRKQGYIQTTALVDRVYDDGMRVLNLRIQVSKGPQYRFGAVTFTGLSPEWEGRARQLWRAKAGDPYDFSYAGEFFREFSREVNLRNFRKYDALAKRGAGDHVMDVNVVFTGR